MPRPSGEPPGSWQAWRAFLFLLIVVAVVWAAVGQTPVPMGSSQAIAFDYGDEDLIMYAVTHFEASWDAAAFAPITTERVTLTDTPAGFSSYRFVPPFTSGTHTLVVRACNVEGCGGPSDPFRLRLRRR